MDGGCEERLLDIGLRSDSNRTSRLRERSKKCHGGKPSPKCVHVGRKKVMDVLEARREFWGRVV